MCAFAVADRVERSYALLSAAALQSQPDVNSFGVSNAKSAVETPWRLAVQVNPAVMEPRDVLMSMKMKESANTITGIRSMIANNFVKI